MDAGNSRNGGAGWDARMIDEIVAGLAAKRPVAVCL